MELVGPIIEIVKCIGTPICKNLKYHRNLAEDLNTLQGILGELNHQKEDMESRLREELRFGKIRKKEVEDWLQNVEGINREIRLVEEKANNGKCFSRASLGKKVEKKSQEVKELSDKGRSFNSLVFDTPTRGVRLSTTTLAGETTTNKNLNEIWNYLIGDEVRKIGVCGMGGVGKTTIMKHVYNKLLNEAHKFEVIWITVSQPLDLAKLQNNIATALKEDLSKEEDAATRAGILLRMLEQRKGHVLILDDLWKKFHLEEVGIPEPTRETGCKLIITTRSTDVCRSMGCKIVQVKPLSEEEALDLFLDKVGPEVLQNPTLKEIVNLIVQECAGLPLAIITIASSMMGVDDVHEWKNALNELCKHIKSVNGVEDEIFGRLQFSYDRLQHQVVQYCFLYCALYPEDFEIPKEELIEHWIDEGHIDEMETRLDMYHRGYAILKKLENNCLLERVKDEKYVKMHDLVRDMALRIASGSPRFMLKADKQLKELPPEHEWRDVEKVFLMRNSVTVIPPDMSPECQTLTTLLLWRNPLTMIHESFFAKMVRLEILDLSYTDIKDLPASIFDLKNLTALLIEGCGRLRHVPDLISKLQALKKLVLGGTSITKVPQGMAKLKNLRYLDLNIRKLIEMPAGLLPELSRLQHLKLYVDLETLKVKGEELAQLRKLETFEGQLYGVHDLNMYVESLPRQKGPNQYSFHVRGPNQFPFRDGSKSKYVSINGFSISGDSLVLPTTIHELNIVKCHDVRSLSDISSLKDATDLRRCGIVFCKEIECVFSLSSSFSYCTTLEGLYLYGLENLRVLIKGGEAAAVSASPPPPATFSHLRTITIYKCPKIKKLFWLGLLWDLQNLEEIDVKLCDQMEEIIRDDEENHEEITFTLPKFKVLKLWRLPELKSVCSRRGVMVCDSLQQIQVIECPKLKRMPFSLPLLHNGQPSPPPSLKEISVIPKEWWESVEWDHPNAKNVLLPFLK